MNNKVLVKLIVPELDVSFDVFIPVNEIMWKVKRMLLKSVTDLVNIPLQENIECVIMNKDTCKIYSNNEVVINTDIRNSTELILISSL